MKSRFLLLALPAVASCANWSDDIAGPSINAPAAPALEMQGTLADRYIVVFNDDVQNPAALSDDIARQAGATVHYRYTSALKGFAATIPGAALEGIQRNPNVAYVEADGIVTASTTTQSPATWGLDRIDQRNLPLSNSYSYDSDGSGVTVYIIDTGIRTAHNEFGGRASVGYDALGGTGEDCNGHGTHVAGTVGGATYGVAKAVALVAVRVLNCRGSGTTSGVIAGIDWVKTHRTLPAVANMSLGGGASSTLDNAVNNAVNASVTFAVAAGNSNANACNYSPARAASALTVGATTSSDARASYSNFGTCLDVFAPGSSITSAWSTSNTATNTISGTSMASPHVAGVAALIVGANPSWSPAQVETALEGNATTGKVTSAGTGSPNLLLYSLFSSGGGGGNTPPTASFSDSCTDLSCSFDASGSSNDVVSYSWNFGDNTSSGSGASVNHTYAAGGTYTVVLTVTDDGGLVDTDSRQITVSAPPPSSGDFPLSARGFKVKGVQNVELMWSDATGANVDVYRNGVLVGPTSNDGIQSYNLGVKGPGRYEYQVCEQTGTRCSNIATVVF